ncbi:MAG: ATP-dependent helicase [bacterium]
MDVKKYILQRPKPVARPDWGDVLDDEQRAVVEAPAGYVLAVAGAGSGKTRALTYRVAHLLHQGTRPERLMLCTFTNRAAREMLRRVEGLANVEVSRMWAGTFHHVGNRVLRRYGEAMGQTADYSILDRADATELLARVIAGRRGLKGRSRFPRANVLGGLISLAANTGRTIAWLLLTEYRRFAHDGEEIEAVAAAYHERKNKLGVRDFDDLLLGWRDALTAHPDVAAELQDRFQHVLVDEYQDVNRLQAEITDAMAQGHGSLTVVGDDDQSIYSFRGADSDAILRFGERHPTAVVYKIQNNYRSTPQILSLASRSVAHNAHRHDKTLRAVRTTGELPVVVGVDDVYQQAAFVAQRVLEIHEDEDVPLAQMAVLFRAHAHSLELQVELTRRQIPFTVRAGLRFFEQAHIKDALAHLRWQTNPQDELAAMRVLRLQPGIGASTATRTMEHVQSLAAEPVFAGLFSAREHAGLSGRAQSQLRRLAELFGQLEAANGPAEALRTVLEGPYRDYALRQFANAEERLQDLSQLADHAERYDTTSALLSDIALMAGMAAESFAPDEAPDDCLTLSTIHQAKGLEWRVVFVLWLCDGHFPSAPALRDPGGEQEERRLFHVAATRARDQLTLVHPLFAEQRGLPRVITRVSRFLGELEGQDLFERWRIELE